LGINSITNINNFSFVEEAFDDVGAEVVTVKAIEGLLNIDNMLFKGFGVYKDIVKECNKDIIH
jgi:imidazoleglycerol phosphate synthase glutamine amidotransferase subunit HisH